ncbi:MAG: purine-nucleoside phosphorylase [Treponema sp.]|nr:purine-nucleoside phosphorylase [Treponema sp.]
MHHHSQIHTPTPHNAAHENDIAPFVLFPGDPLRAEWIAHTFLTDARQVTAIRGMLGFTGTYGTTPVTVMGSGMGGASAGLYAYELFSFYHVDAIVRVGTAAGFQPTIKVGDIIFAMTASTDSNYAVQYQLPGLFSPAGDFSLLQKAAAAAEQRAIRYAAGALFSSDTYSEYNARGTDAWQTWARMGCLAQDMETYALYCTAAYCQKRALTILTTVYSSATHESIEGAGFDKLTPMIETALSLATYV